MIRSAKWAMDLAADGNDNGTVDAADYGVWRAHFGNTADLAEGLSPA